MAIGIVPTKEDIDKQSGYIARDLDSATGRCIEFKEYLDGVVDDELVALGYTPDEVGVLRSAYLDAAKLAMIFRGQASDANAYDYRVFLKRLWGFGAL